MRLISFALLCFHCAVQAKSVPASRPESGPGFRISEWREAIRKIDFDAHNRNHPGPYNGWFSPDNDDCATRYIITWGPLGIRTLMHDHSWGNLPAFRRAWPTRLQDARGDLLFDCFEVIDVIPGSPADGHLQKGDLLIAMDGGLFRTALSLRPDRPLWKHQGSRALEIDVGERLDLAEGRGRISFDVIRPGDSADVPVSAGGIVRELGVSEELPHEKREVEIEVPVVAGQQVSVTLELTRGGNGSCGAELIAPRLEGPGGTLDLSAQRRISEHTGWGAIRRGGITYKDKEVEEALWFHAPGHLTWVVPPGFNRFRATVVSPPAAAGYKVKTTSRVSPRALPPQLAGLHRVVNFNIPKIGSYGRGFPHQGDAKSRAVADMTAAWLVDHQQEDGSWKRNVGYTHNGYDTAWAGLGLLAHADPAHAENIRKAAEYIAFRCPQDGWAVPSSVMILFLSEYWLRTKDERILVPLQSQLERLRGEMVYGDWNGGHGHNPGYGGSGVSTGGSHMALAFAVANLTPAKVEPGLIDKMLARAQELGPDGFIPYGRNVGTREFVPNLDGAGTYSGRHGPYLIASHIHGGPRLFTANCRAMYEKGPPGGIDQGHATDSLSTSWALLASASADAKILARQMEAMRWKFTMLRCWDGGFGWNAQRLEYMGGEGLLPPYLRSGAYLIAYNATKKNLAITGAPQWQAKHFPDLPPVCHDDAVALGYYQRNWGVAATALGDKAPASLKSGLASLLKMGKTADTHAELYGFLRKNAATAARDLLALSDVDDVLRHHLAEMVLGVDVRLAVELDRSDDQPIPGRWNVRLDAQHPLAGWWQGATDAERAAWRAGPPLPMAGEVRILNVSGKNFGTPLPIQPDFGNHGLHTRGENLVVPDGPTLGPLSLVAHIRYRVGDMSFDYKRPITADGFEAGNGEKGRKILGDRVVWVPGRLDQDLNGWNGSFTLPSGQFIAAATQGVATTVARRHQSWISPTDGTVPLGTRAEFGFSSGWQFFEARLASIRLGGGFHEAIPAAIRADGKELDLEPLMDHDRETGVPLSADAIEIELKTPTAVRGVDLRLKSNGRDQRMTIQARTGGDWQTVFAGRPGDRSSAFPAVTTDRVRVTLERGPASPADEALQELRIFPVIP